MNPTEAMYRSLSLEKNQQEDLVNQSQTLSTQPSETLRAASETDDGVTREAIRAYREWQNNSEAMPDYDVLETIVLALEYRLDSYAVLVAERDKLKEACKKALTCASLNSDVRALIVAALATHSVEGGDDDDEPTRIPCSKCGKPTTFDSTYGDLCYRCCRASNE